MGQSGNGYGCGLYGEMRHHSRNPGERFFDVMSYGSKVIGSNIKLPHGGAITGLRCASLKESRGKYFLIL